MAMSLRHRGRSVPRRIRSAAGTAALLVAAFVASAAGGSYALRTLPEVTAAAPRLAASFRLCGSAADATCVVDGDTFRIGGEIIRIADIDTPETHEPRCASERRLGLMATQRMMALLNAGPFEIAPYERNHDQYGRSLRIVMRDGQSLGARLVGEGLARVWDGSRHPWC
jgi:endonuclease YncB( thermonuclease family)